MPTVLDRPGVVQQGSLGNAVRGGDGASQPPEAPPGPQPLGPLGKAVRGGDGASQPPETPPGPQPLGPLGNAVRGGDGASQPPGTPSGLEALGFRGFAVRGSDGATLIPATPAKPQDPGVERRSDLYVDAVRKTPPAGGKPFVEIIVPSITMDPDVLKSMLGVHLYEERALWQMAALGPAEEGRPPIRQVMVLSQPIPASTFEYVLQLLGGIRGSQSKDRVMMFVGDGSTNALTEKILGRPELLKKLKDAGADGSGAHLLAFVGTEYEQMLADILGIPLMANDPKLNYWGTKQGSRSIFGEAGIPHPDGIPEVRSVREMAEGVAELVQRNPDAKRVVLKLADGFSGDGNAELDLAPLRKNPPKSAAEWVDRVEAMLPEAELVGESMTWPIFASKIEEMGAIAELYVEGKTKHSPSVQGKIHDDGSVEILSTHEQVLKGQVFIGAKFPADDAYRELLQEYGRKVGESLSAKGALGRFAVDFICPERIAEDGTIYYEVKALEINLREGGTTHPYETLKVLTGGTLDPGTGLFKAADGTLKYYFASDNIQDDRYIGLNPGDAADIAYRHGLHFDPETQTGIAFHMLGLLRDYGKVGVTCMANSREEAQKMYDDTIKALDSEFELRPKLSTLQKEAAEAPEPPTAPLSDKPAAPLFMVGDRQTLLRPKDGIFNDWMRSISFSPDLPLIAAAVNNRGDFSVRINDRVTGAELHSLTGPTMPIREVAFGPKNLVVAGAADGSVTVWDAEAEKQLWSVRHPDLINTVAFTRDGELVAAGDAKGNVALYNAKTGEQVFKAKGQEGWVRTAAFSPSGETLAVGFADGTVRLFDVESHEELEPLRGHPGGAFELSFSDDGRLLAVSSGNGSVSVWHMDKKKLLHRLEREWKTGKASFAPGGDRLAFGSTDGSVRIYDWKCGTETMIRNFDSTPTELKQANQLGPVRWSDNGHSLTAVAANGALHEWNFS